MNRLRTPAPRRRALRPALSAAALLGALGALPACSPVVRVRTEFRPPPGVALDPARFHLSLAHECDPYDLTKPKASPPAAAPPPSSAPPPVVAYEAAARGAGLDVQISVRGSRCWVWTTGWLDANGNGALDRGDAVGSLPAAVLGEDKGMFGGNLVGTTPVPLAIVSGPLATAAAPPPNAPPGAPAAAQKAGPQRPGCEGLFDPPEGAVKLCDEHAFVDGAEIHWTSWAVTTSSMATFGMYKAREDDCDAGSVFKPPAPLVFKPALQVSRGGDRVSFHNAGGADYPSCATKPDAGYRTVVVISTKRGR